MSTRSAAPHRRPQCLAMVSAVAFAAESPNLGGSATPEEIAAWDISIGPDGVGLPPGSGTPKQGEAVYAAKCVACHGEKGAGKPNDQLVGGKGRFPATNLRCKTVGSFWPYATTVFDYVRRAMPYQRIEVADQRRGLCGRRLYPEPQRHHRRQRHDGRANAAESENAEPRRIRDVFARKMNAAG